MRWGQFKKEIKEDLYSYQSEESAVDIWNAIETRVDKLNYSKRKKRRTFFPWLIIGSFIVVASIGIFYQNKMEYNSNVSTSILDDTVQAVKYERLMQNKESEIENSSHDAAQHLMPEISAVRTSSSVTIQKPKKNHSGFGINSNSNIEGDLSLPFDDLLKLSAKDLIKRVEHQKAPKYKAPTFTEAEKLPLAKINAIEFIPDQIEESIFEFHKLNSASKIIVTPENKITLGIYSGIAYTIKELKLKSLESKALLDQRMNTEKSLETLQIGVNFNYKLRQGLSLETGFEFTRINEKFNYLEASENSMFTNGIKYQVINVARNIVDVEGQVKQTTYLNTNYKIFNKYNLMDIPVYLSYIWRAGKWEYGLKAGLRANVLLNVKGRILETEHKSIDISKSDIYRKNIGISYGAKLFVGHSLGESILLYFSPNWRKIPRSFTQDPYGIEQQYSFFGAEIGLHYVLK